MNITSVTTTGTTSVPYCYNCCNHHYSTQNCWFTINPIISYPHYTPLNRLGEFDLHLDSEGNLRVIHKGKLLQTFSPGKKK